MALGIRLYFPELTANTNIVEVAAQRCLSKEPWLQYLLFIWENLDECWREGIDHTRLKKGREEIYEAIPAIYLELIRAADNGLTAVNITCLGQTVQLTQYESYIAVSWDGFESNYRLRGQQFLALADILEYGVFDQKNYSVCSDEVRRNVELIKLNRERSGPIHINYGKYNVVGTRNDILDFEERG